jgi:uncharacterized membrane protein YheB (UPF0754 family)
MDTETVQQDTAPEPPAEQPDNFKSEESKQAVLADLAKERDRRQSLEQKLAEFEALQEEQRKAAMSEQERALEEAVAAARTEERSKFAQSRLEDKVRALAARNFNDADDAVRFVDTSGIDVDSAEANAVIAERLDALLEAKPYLKVAGEMPRPSGAGDATSRPNVGGYQPTVGALLKAAYKG